MEERDRLWASAIAKKLFLGGSVGGVRFGAYLQLLIDPSPLSDIKGHGYINLESRWQIFERHPLEFPVDELEIPEPELGERLRLLATLAEKKITGIEITRDYPNLILTLENGTVFFLNGKDDQYESWQLGANNGKPNEFWMVVAMPGGDLAIWAPNSFHHGTR